MVADIAVIEMLGRRLARVSAPVVLDPVMVAASGDRLVPEEAVVALRDSLFPRATIVTPNLPEAAVLLGTAAATDEASMREQAAALAARGPAVLLKGGHMEGQDSIDILHVGDTGEVLTSPRVATRNTHGTGCTLSSAIAAHLARGADLREAVRAAKDYISAAIAAADRLHVGHGRGPVHHFHALWHEPA
jgi:hydroxymethylpyrimidine/phosphomethylpyrimidine kinase